MCIVYITLHACIYNMNRAVLQKNKKKTVIIDETRKNWMKNEFERVKKYVCNIFNGTLEVRMIV